MRYGFQTLNGVLLWTDIMLNISREEMKKWQAYH